MSDAERRHSVRLAEAEGSDAARARVLVDRLRVGTLTQANVELAGYCGDAAARIVLGNGPHEWLRNLSGDGLGTLSCDWAFAPDWTSGLHRWGFNTELRACTISGRLALAAAPPEEDYGTPFLEGPIPLITAVERWIAGEELRSVLLHAAAGWRDGPHSWWRILAAMVLAGPLNLGRATCLRQIMVQCETEVAADVWKPPGQLGALLRAELAALALK